MPHLVDYSGVDVFLIEHNNDGEINYWVCPNVEDQEVFTTKLILDSLTDEKGEWVEQDEEWVIDFLQLLTEDRHEEARRLYNEVSGDDHYWIHCMEFSQAEPIPKDWLALKLLAAAAP